jgi:hypothetical protein
MRSNQARIATVISSRARRDVLGVLDRGVALAGLDEPVDERVAALLGVLLVPGDRTRRERGLPSGSGATQRSPRPQRRMSAPIRRGCFITPMPVATRSASSIG